jgi:hypothetical protein
VTFHTPFGRLLLKKKKMTHVGKDVERLEPLYTVGGNVINDVTAVENSIVFLFKNLNYS